MFPFRISWALWLNQSSHILK